MWKNEVFDPELCGGSVPCLVTEIYVSFHVAQFFKQHQSSIIVFIKYVKRKHDILGVICSSFGASIHRLNICGNGYYTATGEIIVSFCIFSLLKYDRIFGKNLENDTYGVK